MIKLVYFGEKFYRESGSSMSSIYIEDGPNLLRYDYGFMRRDLDLGETVHIRQATDAEMEAANKRLYEILEARTTDSQ